MSAVCRAVGSGRASTPVAESRWPQVAAVFLVSGAAVFLWRLSANMPQLNDDRLGLRQG